MTIESFNKEKEKYYVLHEMFINNHPSIKTDFHTYVIGIENNKMWIWTNDNLNNKIKEKIEDIIKKEISKNSDLCILCKDELYSYLKNKSTKMESFKMGIMICYKLNQINITNDGFIDKPNYGDKLPLAKMCIESYQEMLKQDLSLTEALSLAETWIEDENFYTWKLDNGKLTTTGRIDTIKKASIITQIYTLKEERKKGYCQKLVSELTKMIINNKHIPYLYTDYNNQISNHIYEKIGYIYLGYLMNIKVKEDDR